MSAFEVAVRSAHTQLDTSIKQGELCAVMSCSVSSEDASMKCCEPCCSCHLGS